MLWIRWRMLWSGRKVLGVVPESAPVMPEDYF